jgi:hypothetical protein
MKNMTKTVMYSQTIGNLDRPLYPGIPVFVLLFQH